MIIKNLVRAVLMAAFIVAVPLSARAQALPTPSAGYSFDGYRAVAVTAGLVAGAVIAAVVTDGLIIPVLAATTGASPTGAMAGAGGGMAAGMGQGAVHGFGILRGTMRLLGAVSGGMYADTLYLNR